MREPSVGHFPFRSAMIAMLSVRTAVGIEPDPVLPIEEKS